MKLYLYEMMIPGDFKLEFKVPIWQDSITNFDSSEILNIALSDVDKNLDLKDLNNDKALTHWHNHNIFSLENCAINSLKEKIKMSYNLFVEHYQVEAKKHLYINGWFSILRKGNHVKKHCHSTHQNSYLTGTFTLSDACETPIDFFLPQFEHLDDVGVVKIKNNKHDLIMFPQWLFHSVDSASEDLRIVLAFDLFTEEAIQYYHQHSSNLDYPIKRAVPL